MTFNEVLSQTIAMLQQHGRVSYRALKRQFALDDPFLEDLKYELVAVQQRAVDQDGTMLVWTGDTGAGAAPMPAPATSAAVPPPATQQAQEPLAYTPAYLAEKILTSRSALAGERKQVTVLFADLKGSMELLADRDPEEAHQLLDPVLERMMEAVHRYEGTVNQVMGDGIMALFGAPIAHEDHAVRACYAALAMQAAIRAYAEDVRRTQGLTVQMRVGLNAGEVVVRTIGNDLHMDYSAVGQTTHLAARMEQLANPGSILLTADTLRLVEGLVQVTALGPIPVKGLPDPVEVFELIGASALRRRFQAAAARGLTPFVGRQQELDAVHQALARARTGHGQVVALVGEAGVGKSRLVHECVHSHHTQGWRVLESASVSYGKATPYFPVIDLLKRYCHVDDGDEARTTRAKVTGQVLTLDETLQETLPALLALLDAVPDDSPFLRLDPPQLHAHIVEALEALAPDRVVEQVERLAHHALRGEVWDKAVTCCQQAGARAYDRAAFREAVASFDQSLQALAHLHEHGNTQVLAIELRLAVDLPLRALGENGRSLALLDEAEVLARALDDRAWLGRVLARMADVRRLTGDPDGAITAGQQALELAAALGESALQVRASHHLGQIYHAIGDFVRAAELLRRNVEAADGESGTPSTDLRIQSRAWLAQTLSALGAFAEGRRHGEEALRLATLEGRGTTLIVAHTRLGNLYLAQGDLEHAIRVYDQGLVLCRASGHRTDLRLIAAGLGYASALQGCLAAGRALMEEGISESISTGALLNHALWVAWLSEVCRLAGRGEEAWQHARHALDLAWQHKERANEACALHQLGTVHAYANPPNTEQAEAYYQQSLALAEELGMRPLVAHCHLGLGRLYGQAGQREQAHTELSTAITMYRAMDMTFWLPQAEAVLAQIEGQ